MDKFSIRLSNHFRAIVIGKSVVPFQIDTSTVENKLLALKQSTLWLTLNADSYPETFNSEDKIAFSCLIALRVMWAGTYQSEDQTEDEPTGCRSIRGEDGPPETRINKTQTGANH